MKGTRRRAHRKRHYNDEVTCAGCHKTITNTMRTKREGHRDWHPACYVTFNGVPQPRGEAIEVEP